MALPPTSIAGTITLNGSKSISNRILMIQAISGEEFSIEGLSNARDTQLMQGLLQNVDNPIMDAREAGTVYRFMTAYLAWRGHNQVLMGTKRMCERPIGLLADALNELGANIHYVGKVGYPPLQMKAHDPTGWQSRIHIGAHISSQFISALLLIAPVLPNGIEMILEGKIISRPYIRMTLRLMEEMGIVSLWHNDVIKVPPQSYEPHSFVVEADWSAASYYYSIAALSEQATLQLNGLHQQSVQGDAVLVDMMRVFGVETTFNEAGIELTKLEQVKLPKHFTYDFSNCPDLAQTIAVLCAGLNLSARLEGLETLTIKETDRIAALKTELEKMGCIIEATTNSLSILKGITDTNQDVQINTYDDHRMAMAFAPLRLLVDRLEVDDPFVVRKSYPDFWKDLASIGLNDF